ncbi:PTS ascorbate transporter subunit IIC [Maledivibacter halophilus]|uniref:Ascorbate-specific PTS system EIIC component n=1 Tax=Maledivibacter halophilus TaxID=36842 RepID=A0A1T5MN57_9FIRM|nr:PTS ascorbate transporter subunit IIC [Maledivibacter halophilus]SKC89660.1 PTS system IIC component, L-Asc family [Maledivibacter halophilus]
MGIISYLTNNIFKQPPILLGLIALVGLLVQRKNFSDIIKGTFKTIIGVIVLFKGVNIISSAISPLAGAFSTLYALPKGNQFDPNAWVNFIGSYGSEIGIVILFAFIINLIVARITPVKNIFLTGHIFFWMSYIFVAVGVESGLSGTGLIIFATIFLSIYIIVTPALMRPLVKKVTGTDQFTVGHSTTIFCFIGAGIGKLLGNKENSTEDLKVPKYLDFFKETTIATSLILFFTYIIVGLIIGSEARQAVFGGAVGTIGTIGGMKYDLFSFSLMAGLTFGAGLTVLLAGVRLMLGEIVPAFKGISDKLIPNSVPALDVPMIFPYAPNALTIGFLASMVTSILTIVIMASAGAMTYAIIPLTVACFFDIAPSAIIANAYGGRRGAVIASAINGIAMVLLVSFAMPVIFNTVAGFNQAFGGNDFSLWAIIGSLFSKMF